MNNNSTSLPFTKVNLTLTSEAVDFLSETTSGTSHFAILIQLIKNMSVTPSSTTKRGNVIMLDVGQVECSIHSYCAKFGIGRKKFEAIMRKMEQHSIIRMHRSRLATVADLACITSWLLPDGSTMTNGIDGNPADHSDGQPNNHAATPHASSHVHDGKADAASVLGGQSISYTDRPSAPESSVTPMGEPGTPDLTVNRGYPQSWLRISLLARRAEDLQNQIPKTSMRFRMIETFFKEASLCFWSPKTSSATIRPRIAASFDATGFALHGVRHTDAASHTTEPDRKLAILKTSPFPTFIYRYH